MTTDVMYVCENCSQQLDVDKAFVWQKHVVCYNCFQSLHVQGGKLQTPARKTCHTVIWLTAGFLCGGVCGWFLHAVLVT